MRVHTLLLLLWAIFTFCIGTSRRMKSDEIESQMYAACTVWPLPLHLAKNVCGFSKCILWKCFKESLFNIANTLYAHVYSLAASLSLFLSNVVIFQLFLFLHATHNFYATYITVVNPCRNIDGILSISDLILWNESA